MKRFLPILLIALLQWTTEATLWYVDSTASGSNNGTSWANAWQSLPAISWGSVHAGDTVYISGGSTSQTYGGYLDPSNDGTSGSPITITCGIGAGKDGIVIFDGAAGGDAFSYVALNGRQNITIDGQSGGDGLRHFALVNLPNATDRTFGNKILADGSIGVTAKYLAFTNVNQCISLVSASFFRVANCIGDDIRGDAAVRAPNSFPDQFDANIVENNYFQIAYSTNGHGFLGPDGVQGSHGMTIRNNVFSLKRVNYDTSTQHPDYIQVIGNHLKVYGNEFINVGDSCVDMDWWVNPNPHDIRIYNNVFRLTFPADPYPEFIRWYASAGASITSIQRLVIANNTFVDNAYMDDDHTGWAALLNNWGASGNPSLSGWVIANNVYVNTGAYAIADNPSIGSGNALGFQNNVYSSSYSLSYRTSIYSPTAWSAVENTRRVGLPTFASYTAFAAGNDFHLASSDTVARGAGVDLSAYFNTDKDGNVRSSWDAGAYAYNTTGTPPTTPTITSPADGATSVGLTPTIIGSAYSDPALNTQTDAQFQVLASDGATVVWDSGSSLGAVNLIAVPGAILNYSTVYKPHCRYKSSIGLWSAYSPTITFTTLAAPTSGPGSGTWNVGTVVAGDVGVQH